MTYAVQARVYAGPTEAVSAQQFQVDAAEAARHGWIPISQVWAGTNLTVTYQPQVPWAPATMEPDERPPTEAGAAEPSVGAYLKAIGLALVLLVPTSVVLVVALRTLGLPERLTITFSGGSTLGLPALGYLSLFIALAISVFAVGRWRKVKGRKQWLVLSLGATVPILLLFVVIPMVLLIAITSSY